MIAAVLSCWTLLLGIALMMLGNGLQGTLLGIRASLEGFPTTLTGLIMSSYYLGFVFGSTLTPRLVARVGHVRVFAALASLASTAILLHAMFVSPETWAVIRLASGFCYAGLFVVAESWLNTQATNETRGQLLSVYMVLTLGGMALGQILLNVAAPDGVELFVLVSVLVSLSLIPMMLAAVHVPPHEAHSPVSLRELFRISPLGTIGMGATGATQGAFFGMGAVYGSQIGLSVAEISIFMSAMLLGGVLLQWPVGRLSDRFDRRRVITLVTLMAATFAGIASIVVAGSETHRILILFLFGAVNLPMYALCIAHTNDYLEPTQFVEASGTLVLIAGLGAAVGPLAAAAFMDLIGPHGFFLFLAGIHLSVGGFALYRMTRRAATPLEDQGDYVPLPPRATPTATAIYADVMAEAASHEPEVTPAPVPVASGS